MTSNRLTAGTSGSHSGGGGPMMPGDTRTIFDKIGGRTWTLTRTNRDYAQDLADAYNAPLAEKPLRWEPQHNSELKLRVLGEGRDHAGPQWKPSELERRITKEVCAEFAADLSITQEQFNHMARAGKITRIVQQRMATR